MRKLPIVIATVVVLSIVVSVVAWRRTGGEDFNYRTATADRGWLQATVTATGQLSAVATVQIGTQVSGTLEHVYVDFNSPVKAGEKLAMIEQSSFIAQVEQSEASWKAAEATVLSTKADLEVKKSAVAQAEAGLAQAKSNVSKAKLAAGYAKRTFERFSKMADEEAVSDLDVDTQRNAYEQAMTELEARQASLLTARAEVKSAKSRLVAAEAQIAVNIAKSDQAKAAHELNKVNLRRTVIVSPIDGVVVNRAVDKGQTVAASFSTPTLFEIAKDLRDMQIEADVDEADIGGIKPGALVLFTVEAYPDDEFRGEVTQVRLSPKEEQNVVTYTVIVSAENPDNKLLPGMTADLEFLVAEREGVLRLPTSALRFSPKPEMIVKASKAGHKNLSSHRSSDNPRDFHGKRPETSDASREQTGIVWMIDRRQNLLYSVEVTLGLDDARFTEIIGDRLKEGDQVVTGIGADKAEDAKRPFGIRGGRRR